MLQFYLYVFNQNYTEKINGFIWAAFENHWDLLLPESANRKAKRNIKRILSTKQNISYDIISVNMLIFEIQGNGRDLSITRISYKMTKRTTKTAKFEKSLKMYNIINFKTIRYKLTALGKIIHLIGIYNFMRPVSTLRLLKELKKG